MKLLFLDIQTRFSDGLTSAKASAVLRLLGS